MIPSIFIWALTLLQKKYSKPDVWNKLWLLICEIDLFPKEPEPEFRLN